MTNYPQTGTFLDEIIAYKIKENAECKIHKPVAKLQELIAQAPAPLDFIAALHRDRVALIAEVKHASPSKGVLIEPFDPVAIAQTYAANGAAAISVLVDEKFFLGNVRYLEAVRKVVNLPILFKEFTIDTYQVYEARSVGADAVLLVLAALTDELAQELFALTHELGMTPLVEVHNEAELERALRLNAKLIGVNNRDLKTFHVSLDVTARLAQLLPEDVTLVAESGIRNAADVARMGELGAHAILVGEALVTAPDMAAAVREFSG